MKYLPFSQTKSRSNNLLCAHGWAGQTQPHLWRRISQPARHRFAQAIAGGSEIRKIAAAKKEAAKTRARQQSPKIRILKIGGGGEI